MVVIAGMLAFLFIVGLIGEKIFESIKNNLLKQSLPENQFCETNTTIKPFPTKEYIVRIENAYNEILEQKERQSSSEKYVIILWWGLDGLRLNKDGSNEWISKRKEESTKREQVSAIRKSVKYRGEARTLFELSSMQANIGDMVYVNETACVYAWLGGGSWSPVYSPSDYKIQHCCCTMDYINRLQAQCTQSTQSKILELQERNQQLQFQLAQSEQNRRIVESIQ